MSTSQRISNIELAVKQWSSGINNIGVAQDDLNYASDSVSVSGVDLIKNTFESWSSNGVDVNQDDLNYASDSVSVSGVDLIKNTFESWSSNGVDVNQDDLNYASDSVSVSGVDLIKNTFELWSANGVDVNQDDLNYASDSVLSIPERSFTISNFTPSGSDGLVIQANSNRKEFFIQNLIVAPLYVKYGSNATNTSFNYVLSGTNFTHFKDSMYTGNVSVYSATTPSYISWERT